MDDVLPLLTPPPKKKKKKKTKNTHTHILFMSLCPLPSLSASLCLPLCLYVCLSVSLSPSLSLSSVLSFSFFASVPTSQSTHAETNTCVLSPVIAPPSVHQSYFFLPKFSPQPLTSLCAFDAFIIIIIIIQVGSVSV